MREIREITDEDRRKHEIEKWLITDPNTPKERPQGIIVRIILRPKPGCRRWEWVNKPATPTE